MVLEGLLAFSSPEKVNPKINFVAEDVDLQIDVLNLILLNFVNEASGGLQLDHAIPHLVFLVGWTETHQHESYVVVDLPGLRFDQKISKDGEHLVVSHLLGIHDMNDLGDLGLRVNHAFQLLPDVAQQR